jgi:argininosuccinate lyase
MQEDKEAAFDACDTVKACLGICVPMLETMTVQKENMLRAAREGFINATDLADYLVEKGLPFRSAYKVAGQAVALCSELGCSLELLPLAEYRKLEPRIDEDVYAAIDLAACVLRRSSEGGTGPESLRQQLAAVRQALEKAAVG